MIVEPKATESARPVDGQVGFAAEATAPFDGLSRFHASAFFLAAVVALGYMAQFGQLSSLTTAMLASGASLAIALRWGGHGLLGAASATLVTPLLWQASLADTLRDSAALTLGVWIAWRQLTAMSFDRRLERASHVGSLVLVWTLVATPTAAVFSLLIHAAMGETAQNYLLPTLVWACAMAVGGLVTALPAMLFERGMFDAVAARKRWPASLALIFAVGALTTLAHGPGVHSTGWAPVLQFMTAPLVLALLVQAGLPMASLCVFALCLGLLSWSGANGMLEPLATNTLALHVGAPMATLLALTLIAHASRASALWRENRWEWALDGSRLGVADWHLHEASSFVSATWVRLTAHEGGRWSPQHWLAKVHVDDRALLGDAIAAVASGQEGRSQLEIRMPSGPDWRWFETTLLVIERDLADKPVRLLATVADVDERHDAQQRQRLSVSLFQHLHEGLLITDEHMRALDVNPAYCQILGISRDELLGSVPSVLHPAPPDPLARQQRVAMWAALNASGGWRGELMERRRNGELCTLQVTVSTVLGAEEDLRYHVLVISDITEQHVQRERLERQAHFDELTRLPNRTRLSELLSDAMRAADRDGYLLVVCYLDLDHFKPVNDRFGHAAGDRLLAELAGRLRSALRTREAWADAAARLGGDEFVLLLRAGTLDEGRLAVERVLRVVSQPYLIDPANEPVQVTASMGATVYPIDHSDADTLLRHADHAMYGAKQSGRNGYLFFDPEHRRRTEERVMAIGRVQEALDQSEFVLFYQPKVDMRSGRVLGLEALLRWDHPQQGLIAPLQFLPLIENTGLSSRIGDWVLAQALEHLSLWRRSGLDISVGVNISARHIQEPDFALRLSELLARYPEGLAPHLELEMLETAAHADIDATSALMARCRTMGVRFALDDFGTGYSTLTYLKRLPVDTLKIDRSFVHHMLDDSQDRAIVEGVIGLARTFGCLVVAEGVESPAQARTLLDLGCEIGQGTGIAAPMPAAQVGQWIHDYRGMFSLGPATLPGALGTQS